MKDPASLHNEWLHKNLMQLQDALLSLSVEERHVLRRAWRTLPEQKEEDFMGIPGYTLPAAVVRKIILDLLVEVKEQIEAAAAGAAQ
jgi:hypothetical protein